MLSYALMSYNVQTSLQVEGLRVRALGARSLFRILGFGGLGLRNSAPVKHECGMRSLKCWNVCNAKRMMKCCSSVHREMMSSMNT